MKPDKLEILLLKGGETVEVFSCKTKIFSGAGSLSQLKTLGSKKLLLVTDPYFQQNGTAQQILALSGAAETRIFDKVMPDPSVELAAEGAALAKEFSPDTLVALGGGSAMDCAKAMAHCAGGKIDLVAMPTTAGAGSEVTDFSVLTHGDTKYPLVSEKIRPDMAILDSDLLEGLPKSLVADAGFDVLGHAIEGYTATGAGTITDALAKEAFAIVYGALPASFSGNTQVRGKIHDGATMAGLSFTQAGLGICHAIAHSLGAAYHIPHGRLIAMLLPPVIDCNSHICGKKYATLAGAAGLSASAEAIGVRSLKNGLIRLRKELKMPSNLKEAGVDLRRLRQVTNKLVKAAMEDPCAKTNPLPVADFMVRKILEEVTGRV